MGTDTLESLKNKNFPTLRHFASDNNAGVYPEVLQILQEVNEGHVIGYGDDPFTLRARQAVCDLFEKECAVFFVSNGTAANCLALSSVVRSYHGVIVHEHSHLETDECNALGHFIPGRKRSWSAETKGNWIRTLSGTLSVCSARYTDQNRALFR